ncbi:hypothetical protein L596_026049 [Steinernema carpocapsae]|uniref:YitH acetyltransferase (GNAT) domain-containing protein n=1 Tax=Steinernema carpocapsae TaxID=34508 RepID=A0A4U5M065_STECR|nr:hypothetical protein L596_026049 [Steinernema carpocapsae]
MLRKNGILFQKLTANHVDAVAEFLLTNLPKTSPICQALGFERQDYEAMYIPRITESLPFNLSAFATDESTGEIVAYHLDSFFYRDPFKNTPSPPKKTKKAQILASLSENLRKKFWHMCPRDINCVLRGESSCTREDYQRKGIGAVFLAAMFMDPRVQDSKQCGGLVAVSTSYSNQKLLDSLGGENYAEITYEAFFEKHGISFKRALKDNTTKAVLQFVPAKMYLEEKRHINRL